MSGFDGLADQAATAESTATSDSTQTQTQTTQEQGQQAAENKPSATLDLSKAEKIMFEGQEMTYEDLKKAYMRHQDYTKKTQALAEERKSVETMTQEKKFFDNLHVDLKSVKTNPALAEEFKKVYPQKFHAYLDAILDGQPQSVAKQELPQEVLNKLQEHDEFLSSLKEEKSKAEQTQILGQLETWEQKYTKKYPNAEIASVYHAMEQYTAKMREENPEFGFKNLNERVIEGIYKSVNEHFEKRFTDWQNNKLKTIRDANNKAGDIPPGGGIPGEAPKRMKLKDVADNIVSSEF
jgi:hypothetical protein